jgi:hypothetical protein
MDLDGRAVDEAAVVSTVLDYFEGWFTGDADRMARALHHDLAKRALEQDGQTLDETSAEWMIDATAQGRGRGVGNGDQQIEVTVEDIYKTIAHATVRSTVYREYVHLVRMNDGWKIVNALYAPT